VRQAPLRMRTRHPCGHAHVQAQAKTSTARGSTQRAMRHLPWPWQRGHTSRKGLAEEEAAASGDVPSFLVAPAAFCPPAMGGLLWLPVCAVPGRELGQSSSFSPVRASSTISSDGRRMKTAARAPEGMRVMANSLGWCMPESKENQGGVFSEVGGHGIHMPWRQNGL